jgi:hypothetical protein
MLTYANMNMTRLWCKIVLKISLEQIEGNEGSYFYLYSFEDLLKEALKEASMCALNKKTY